MRRAPHIAVAVAATLAAFATGACQQADAAASPDAALRPLVAAERQCAPLIAGSWPIDLGADALHAPGVDALVAAGLLTREEVRADPLARPQVRIAIAPAGREWIVLRQLNAGGNQTPFLCYGRRELVDVAAPSGEASTARYRFRVVAPAAWTGRDDVRAAYPFLATALAGPIAAENAARLVDGKWALPEHSEWSAGAALADKGFYPCRPGQDEEPCR